MSSNNKQHIETTKTGSNKQAKKLANTKNKGLPAGCLGCGCSTFLLAIIVGIIMLHFVWRDVDIEKKPIANSHQPAVAKTTNISEKKDDNKNTNQTNVTKNYKFNTNSDSDKENQQNEPKSSSQAKPSTNKNLSSNTRNNKSSNASTNTTTSPTSDGQSEYFSNCTELRSVYPNGVPSTHPAYQSNLDRDKDGYACERY